MTPPRDEPIIFGRPAIGTEAGRPCRMDRIAEIARRRGLLVVEDAALSWRLTDLDVEDVVSALRRGLG